MSTKGKQVQSNQTGKSGMKRAPRPGSRQRRRQKQAASKSSSGPYKVQGKFPGPVTRKEKDSSDLMTLAGGHGKNPLAIVNRVAMRETLAAPNQDASLDVSPLINIGSLSSLALGIVLAAKKRGWNSTNKSSNAFQVYCYLMDIFQASIQGSALEFTAAPAWFWALCDALKPKEVPWSSTRIVYEATVDLSGPSNRYSSVLPMGVAGQEYAIVFGDAIGSSINLFPTVVPAPVYDPALGKEQFSSLWNVFVAVPGEPSEIIPMPGSTPMSKDCSAFAMVKGRFGTGYWSAGALVNWLENEVFIECPLFSKFCVPNNDQIDQANYRSSWKALASGGTACYIGPRLLEFANQGQYKNKGRAIYKFYDFEEFVEVFALIIGMVQEIVSKQQNVTLTPYPLSMQQFKVLLRQAIIPGFSNEKAADLRLAPSDDQGANFFPYLPLVVGDNGVSQTAATSPPLLPLLYSEVLRGASRFLFKGEGNQVIDFLPVLVSFRDSLISQYTWDNNGVPTNVFAPPGGEVPIRIVDCSATIGPSTEYLSLNGDEYERIANAHNQWMDAHSAFMTTLSKYSPCDSNPLFCTITMTRLIRNIPGIGNLLSPTEKVSAEKLSAKSSTTRSPLVRKESKTRGVGIDSTRKVGTPMPDVNSQFYQFLEVRRITSSVPFFAEMVKYQGVIITPLLVAESADKTAGSSFVQTAYGEGDALSLGSTLADDGDAGNTSTFPTAYSAHLQQAALDVKGSTSSGYNEIEQILARDEEKGQGGWLSTISNILTAGGKGAKKLAGIFDV